MRRRKSKYTWFPVIPTTVGAETAGASWYDSASIVNVSDLGRFFFQALNIVPDDTINSDEVTSETTLRDAVEGQEYLCERIVGRVWGGAEQRDATPDNWVRFMFGIGIAVMPYEDNDTIALNEDSLDPLGAANMDGSWLYRGIWSIHNNLGPPLVLGPTNIANSGPDYGFVDTRSVRRIHRNERLTIVCSMHAMNLFGDGPDDLHVNWGYDLRVLGQMRKAQGQSTYT